MSVKTLRLSKGWSQEQLAQLSDLNVRTIQRIEKGDSVGLETLKSLAAIFEMSSDELRKVIDSEKLSAEQAEDVSAEQAQLDKAKKKVRSVREFYMFSVFMLVTFVLFLLPNYNDGENLGPLVVSFLCYAFLIGVYAIKVFEPFGEKWEQDKIAKIMNEQSNKHS